MNRRVFFRRGVLGVSVGALGCSPETPRRIARQVDVGACRDFGTAFVVFATGDRRRFVVHEVRRAGGIGSSNCETRAQEEGRPVPPLARALITWPDTVQRLPADAGLPAGFVELVPDSLREIPRNQAADKGGFLIPSQTLHSGKTFQTSLPWTVGAYVSPAGDRLYLVTGTDTGFFIGGPVGELFLEVFSIDSTQRIGAPLLLRTKTGDGTPNLQTYDGERILFVTIGGRAEIQIYLPEEWPSRS